MTFLAFLCHLVQNDCASVATHCGAAAASFLFSAIDKHYYSALSHCRIKLEMYLRDTVDHYLYYSLFKWYYIFTVLVCTVLSLHPSWDIDQKVLFLILLSKLIVSPHLQLSLLLDQTRKKEVSCRSQQWQSLLLIIRNAFRLLWMSSKTSRKMVCTQLPQPSHPFAHSSDSFLLLFRLVIQTRHTISHHFRASCLHWLSAPEWSCDMLLKACWWGRSCGDAEMLDWIVFVSPQTVILSCSSCVNSVTQNKLIHQKY